MELETDVPVRLAEGEAFGFEQHARLNRLLQGLAVIVGLQAAADHEAMQFRNIGVGGCQLGDDRAVFHDVNPVGELQDLVEPMGDEYE